MAEEEFEESEVVFQESDGSSEENEECNLMKSKLIVKKKRKKISSSSSSVPMNIPAINVSSTWNIHSCGDHSGYFVDYDYDDEGEDGEMVPPHVITGRRIAGKVMAFSLCTGNGRTLKGRDLSEVRNSILRLTGFLET